MMVILCPTEADAKPQSMSHDSRYRELKHKAEMYLGILVSLFPAQGQERV